jgi:hypothetical protein
MGGILFGDRIVEWVGTSTFVDQSANLGGTLDFEANSSLFGRSTGLHHDIKGSIYAMPTEVRMQDSRNVHICA